MTKDSVTTNEKIDKALWVVREYIQDAIDTSDIENDAQVDDCTTEIPVVDLRTIEKALMEARNG